MATERKRCSDRRVAVFNSPPRAEVAALGSEVAVLGVYLKMKSLYLYTCSEGKADEIKETQTGDEHVKRPHPSEVGAKL